MKYETTKISNNIKDAAKSEFYSMLSKQTTSSIIWFLVKRHKTALVTIWAVVITLLYLMPFLPDVLVSWLR